MTGQEADVLESLAQTYNRIKELPKEHPNEFEELEFHIHAIQHMIMSRPTRRNHPEFFNFRS